jgi:uncharacterized phage-associated protein
VWDDEPLFHESIGARASGPTVRELYEEYKGLFIIDKWEAGNLEALTETHKDTIGAVLAYYGERPTQWLINLVFKERREVEASHKPSGKSISHEALYDYYSGLLLAQGDN